MNEVKRKQNEKRFGAWEELLDGDRRYWYQVNGRRGWFARYVKEVDREENTRQFYQEIFNERGILVEVHHKYPEDRGHEPVTERVKS